MMRDSLDRVRSVIGGCGGQTRWWPAGDGHLLVLVEGARVLGCRVGSIEDNLFWTPPGLADPSTAGGLLKTGAGGDRLWIGPEVAYHWPDLAQARRDPVTSYKVPPPMDPGEYRIVEDEPGHLRLTNEFAMTDHRINKPVRLRVGRGFDVIHPPEGLPGSVKVASFAVRNDLTLIEAQEGTVAGSWDVLQVPADDHGLLVCPTVQPLAGPPTSYYEPFGDRHVFVEGGGVFMRLDARHRIKLGLSPAQTTGRMAYFRQTQGQGTMIFRAFMPAPGELYVDVPRDADRTFGGDALQAYNDNGAIGAFGEMEYHDPALVAGRTPSTRAGVSVTHVVVGPAGDVLEAGRMLLGVDLGCVDVFQRFTRW